MEDKEFLGKLAGIGINAESGMIYASGNIKNYKELLAVFIRDSNKKMSLIKEKFAENTLAEYTVLVHGLKSNARILGMEALAEQALWHENAGKSGDCKGISEKLPALINMWQELIDDIYREAGSELVTENCYEAGRLELDINSFNRQMERAVMLIEEFEQQEAVNILIKLLEYRLDKKTESSIKAAISLLNDFNYDEALQVLS